VDFYLANRCDRRVDEHEVFAETETERVSKGLPVGPAFMPLAESPMLQAMVLPSRGNPGRAIAMSTSSSASSSSGDSDGTSSTGQSRGRIGSRGGIRSNSKGRSSSSANYGGIRNGIRYGSAGGGGRSNDTNLTNGPSLEEQVERGLISVAEYHRLATASREAEERAENPPSRGLTRFEGRSTSGLSREMGADMSGNQMVLRSPGIGGYQGSSGSSGRDGLLYVTPHAAPPPNRDWMRERPSSRPGFNSGSRAFHK